tara:strand:- start:203 stop:748 length:546 start_codon:yes stop_codon:yes gene_type:complete
MRKHNKVGGGAKTNKNGLQFERDTDFIEALKKLDHLRIVGKTVFFRNKEVALVTEKHSFYREFLIPQGINYKNIISSKLLPDTAVINHKTKDVFIIEKKHQSGHGSVSEKLQTTDFKLGQYKKLLKDTEYKAHFSWLLNQSYFDQKTFEDVYTHIEKQGGRYYFDFIPIKDIKLDESSLER